MIKYNKLEIYNLIWGKTKLTNSFIVLHQFNEEPKLMCMDGLTYSLSLGIFMHSRQITAFRTSVAQSSPAISNKP